MIENPAFSKIALKSIVEVAVQECIIENPRLWTQGAAQAQEYIGEIRRGDAGEELKNRYNNLFPNTGKKRRG